MGAVGGLLGVGGGAAGSGFSGPESANIQTPTTSTQAADQYKNAQAALQQQQAFLAATQAQNGLGNQTNVYNQMQGVANGTGPNPAQAQLAQATGANVANQAALMAGQRGSNANAGLMARQIAQQGAQTQQQSAGQAATLQAQQSLNALNNMGSIANTQAGQQAAATQANTQATQNEQQNILNAIAGQNNANVGMQSNINNVNGQLANTTMQGQQSMIGGLMNGGGASSMMSSLAEGGEVEDEGASSTPNTSTPTFTAAPSSSSGKSGGGAGLLALLSKGGQANAPIQNQQQVNYGNPGANALYKGMSGFGQFLANQFKSNDQTQNYMDANIALDDAARNAGQDTSSLQQSTEMPASNNDTTVAAAHGGEVPALVSPGEQYLPPRDVKKVKEGKNPLSVGERIPGKAKFKGNSYANDTVPKTLEAGGIVIPKSVMESKYPAKEASKFVAAVMARNKHKSK